MNMYVSNLSFHTNEEALRDLFTPFGNVTSAKVINDRESGRSRGFGFVEMESENDATAAIAQFNGQEYDGRNMVVNEARPREDRPRRDRGSYTGGGESYGGGEQW